MELLPLLWETRAERIEVPHGVADRKYSGTSFRSRKEIAGAVIIAFASISPLILAALWTLTHLKGTEAAQL